MSMADKSAGVVYLTKDVEELNIGEMTITPNKGHAEGQLKSASD